MSGYAVPVYLPRRRRIVTPGEWLREKIDEHRRAREATISRISFVNVGAIAHADSGNVTPALPASLQALDIIVNVTGAADNVVCTLPGAYTKKVETNGSTLCRLTVSWTRATGSDSAPLVTHAAGGEIFSFNLAYRGCITAGDPFSDFNSQSNTMSGGTTITAPGISPANLEMVIMAVVEGEVDTNNGNAQSLSSWSGANPTLFERADYNDQGLGTRLCPGGAADGVSNGSTTGNRTVTLAAAPTTGSFSVGALLSLKADSGGGYFPRHAAVGPV